MSIENVYGFSFEKAACRVHWHTNDSHIIRRIVHAWDLPYTHIFLCVTNDYELFDRNVWRWLEDKTKQKKSPRWNVWLCRYHFSFAKNTWVRQQKKIKILENIVLWYSWRPRSHHPTEMKLRLRMSIKLDHILIGYFCGLANFFFLSYFECGYSLLFYTIQMTSFESNQNEATDKSEFKWWCNE